MEKQPTFSDWEQLFRHELKGKSPEDFLYHPQPGIQIPPYLSPTFENPTLSIAPGGQLIHHLYASESDIFDNIKTSKDFSAYRIGQFFSPSINTEKRAPHLQFLTTDVESNLESKPEDIETLQFSISSPKPTDLNNFLNLPSKNQKIICFELSDDLFLNVAWIRGCQKIMHHRNLTTPISLSPILRLTVEQDLYFEMIRWSYQSTAALLCGLHEFIWDISTRETEVLDQLPFIFNIPEILLKEGGLQQYGDGIQGAEFFEKISDEVVDFLNKLG